VVRICVTDENCRFMIRVLVCYRWKFEAYGLLCCVE
jgi:hypothetical protein